uniref:Z-protein n=2 Tax=unclassified Reptarenavirus TaxID=1654822 RepID=A0A1P8PFF0_9VIRU|nr:Z-protein [Keijut pohjoismaissa virus]AZI72633.1 Z protein [Keijut pohjoismaissa virus 1]APX61251.1 Z-protein [Keijut pohjoismaissa virus]AZI72656.1 Z protein [Keijut pohjoismaissa virus 1]AZI72661.1 Z protein [Keijut pohjoismaissa virus 1]
MSEQTSIGLTTEIISIITFVIVIASFVIQVVSCITMLAIKGVTLRKRLRFCQGCGKNASLVVLPCKNSVCMECALKMKCPVCFEPCLWCENPDGSLTSLALVNREMGAATGTTRV